MTRRDVTYAVLRDHANEWVSAYQPIEAGAGLRYSARVHDLREAGHTIETRRDPTGQTTLAQYRLVLRDVAPGQSELWNAA